MQRKVVIIGADGVGKTSFVNRLFGGRFDPVYEHTTRVGIYKTPKVDTKVGDVILNIWDISGEEYGYILGTDIAIVMFDVGSKSSYKEAKKWIRRVKEIAGSRVETILCGNKCDIVVRKVVPSLDFFDISTKTGYNIENVIRNIFYKIEDQETREIDNQMSDD